MFKRKPQPINLSAEEQLRLDAALADLAAVDPKARADFDFYLSQLQGLWQLLGPSEKIIWLQHVTFVTGADGQIDMSTFTHGALVLTDQHLVFTGSRPDGGTRTGRWALTELSTVDLAHRGFAGKDDMLQVGTGSAQMGFATKHRGASQEFLRRVRTAIAQARDGSSKTQVGSTADELARWAKLRNDGVISEEEFAVQKTKILGQ